MQPVTFKESNCVYAANQKEYKALPALKFHDEFGTIVFCSKMNLSERLKVLFTGKVWVSICTFDHKLQPSFLSVNKSDTFQLINKPITKWTKIKMGAYNLLKVSLIKIKQIWKKHLMQRHSQKF